MEKILLTTCNQELINNKWVTTQKEERYIDDEEYRRIISKSWISLTKALGGNERMYRENGRVYKLVSTSPDKDKRIIYNFKND